GLFFTKYNKSGDNTKAIIISIIRLTKNLPFHSEARTTPAKIIPIPPPISSILARLLAINSKEKITEIYNPASDLTNTPNLGLNSTANPQKKYRESTPG